MQKTKCNMIILSAIKSNEYNTNMRNIHWKQKKSCNTFNPI